MAGVESRKWRAAEIVGTVVGVATVLVAVIALLLDHPPFGGGADADPAPGPPTSTSTPTAQAGPAGQRDSPRRYLSDLPPDSGGGNVQRVGSHSLRMQCASGESDDPNREVTYVLPRAMTYRSFSTGFSAAGQRDSRIQAVLLVDQRQIDAPVVTAGSSTRLTWSGAGAGQLTLRILCDAGATAATFTDAGLSS